MSLRMVFFLLQSVLPIRPPSVAEHQELQAVKQQKRQLWHAVVLSMGHVERLLLNTFQCLSLRHCVAAGLASAESSITHAARKQKLRFCSMEQHVRRESLRHRRQAALLEQLALGPSHALYHQASHISRRVGQIHIHSLVLGL